VSGFILLIFNNPLHPPLLRGNSRVIKRGYKSTTLPNPSRPGAGLSMRVFAEGRSDKGGDNAPQPPDEITPPPSAPPLKLSRYDSQPRGGRGSYVSEGEGELL